MSSASLGRTGRSPIPLQGFGNCRREGVEFASIVVRHAQNDTPCLDRDAFPCRPWQLGMNLALDAFRMDR
jgi:hypothetical protein